MTHSPTIHTLALVAQADERVYAHVPDWHRRQILLDKRLGMTAYETLYHWPYERGVDLATVEAVRRSCQ